MNGEAKFNIVIPKHLTRSLTEKLLIGITPYAVYQRLQSAPNVSLLFSYVGFVSVQPTKA